MSDLKKSLYFLRNYVYRVGCDASSYSGMRISTAEALIEKIQHAIDHIGNDHCEDYDPPNDFEPDSPPAPCQHDLFTGMPGGLLKCFYCGKIWLDSDAGPEPVEKDEK